MEIIFLGLLYRKDEEKQLMKYSKVGLPTACNIYQWNVLEGLEKNLNKEINIISSIPVGNFPSLYSKVVISGDRKGENIKEIGFINFYYIKHLIRFLTVYKEIKKIVCQNKKEEICIITYDLYLPFLKAVNKIKNKYSNIKTCVIVTDLPGELGYDNGKRGIAKKILNLRGKKELKYAKKFDSYVLLTEQMKYPLMCEKKEYVVIEGIANENIENNDEVKSEKDKKIIFYTGMLAYQYGINDLLEAFVSIEDENYELWLCGQGDMEEKIKKISEKDKRIKFFGYIPKSKVLELQKEITVFINPRKNEGLYTQYSFPSKTMEYLLSGKPFIGYKLDGIPDEYDKYINYISEDSIVGIKNSIINVCEKKEVANKRAKSAQEFVLKTKNKVVQVKKILNMIEHIESGSSS